MTEQGTNMNESHFIEEASKLEAQLQEADYQNTEGMKKLVGKYQTKIQDMYNCRHPQAQSHQKPEEEQRQPQAGAEAAQRKPERTCRKAQHQGPGQERHR